MVPCATVFRLGRWVVRYATFASIPIVEDAHGSQRPISMN